MIILGSSKSINGNNVVMMLALKTFSAWFVVLFTIAAIFSAIIPAGPIVMTSASLIVRNVCQAIRPQTSEPKKDHYPGKSPQAYHLAGVTG